MGFELKEATVKGAELVLNKLKTKQIAMLTVDTGGGKTYISLHTIGQIVPNANIIVFGPKAKTTDGDWEESTASYNEVMGTNMRVTVYNYEKLDNDTFFKTLMKDYSYKTADTVLIMDEAHRLKTPTGVRATRITKFSKQPAILARILLTATPITNSYMDAISYLIMAGFYKNKSDFTKTHVKFWDKHHQPVVRDKAGNIDRNLFNLPDLIDQELDTFVVNFDVSELKPPTETIDYRFNLSKAEQKEYNKIYRDYKNGMYEHIQAARKAMFDYINDHSQQKLDKISEILKTTDKPVIIFYLHNVALYDMLDYFEKNHPDYTIEQMNGHVIGKKRVTKKPKSDKTIRLVQYQAGAEGWNAQWSDTTIFYEPIYSYEKFHQSDGRNVRAYMDNKITHYTLGINKTLEEMVWYALENKQSFSDGLIENFYDDDFAIHRPNPKDLIDPNEKKTSSQKKEETKTFELLLNLTQSQAQELATRMKEMGITPIDSHILNSPINQKS